MAAAIFEKEHQILFYETDQTGCVTLSMLVNLFMLASQEQSNQLGLTAQKIHSQGLGWVVTQHLINIDRFPKLNERIKIKTQAKTYNRFFCYRDFWITDQENNVLAKMQSVFVLLDQKKRKLTKVLPKLVAPYKSAYSAKVEHLSEPLKMGSDQTYPPKDYRVRFMDLDGNQHVNNVHYFDWLLDALPREFLLSHQLKQVNIRYKHEVYYGQIVKSRVWLKPKASQIVSLHEISSATKENCRAEFHWER